MHNDNLKAESISIISFILDSNDDEQLISYIASGDVLHVLCESLSSSDANLFLPALKALGTILTSNDPLVIDRCLWAGLLSQLSALLTEKVNCNSVKEVLWALSNVTADNSQHVGRFVELTTLFE